MTKLKEMFLDYNGRYFRNSLPKETVIVYGNLSKYGWLGSHHVTSSILDFRKSKHKIVIDTKLKFSSNLVRATLLHEMVHEKLYKKYGHDIPRGTHGPLFQKEMKKLAKIGAFNRLW